MGITAQFKSDIDNLFNLLLKEIDKQIIESLCRVGEEAVKLARLPHENDWTDQTGNLRSSIGYVVFVDGKQHAMSTFDNVPPNGERKQPKNSIYNGSNVGYELAKQVGQQTQGYALVVVAGMNYAVHVESKGRDVLTSAEKQAEKNIAKELADLVTNVKKAFE